MSGTLVRYEAMRREVAGCARVDEAAQLRDKAAALAAYAKQRDDKELHVWMSEIHKRACIRIGQLSRELETALYDKGHGTVVPSSGKYKADVLAEAGISTSAAYRYEELAGGRAEQGQAAASAAAEAYFAQSRANNEPATSAGLRGAIRAALIDTLGPPPERGQVTAFARKPDSILDALTDFSGAVRTIAELAEPDMRKLAARVQPGLVDWHRAYCAAALARLQDFTTALEKGGEDAA